MIKKLVDRGIRFFVNKDYRFLILSECGLYKKMDDEEYIKRRFKAFIGSELVLDNPKTFNEKIQWLKLYYRNDLYSMLADKIQVKEWVAEKIGNEYIIPLLGVWESPDEIDFERLPNAFVVKCNHNSGLGMIICKDKNKIKISEMKKNLQKGLKENKYLQGREWAYKNVHPRIFAEEYMEDSKTKELRDYKFFCFNGEAKLYKIDYGRFSEHHANYYNLEGEILPFGEEDCPPNYSIQIEQPKKLTKMIELANVLSKEIPFVRVDFYEVDGKIYFGEMTFYPTSGFGKYTVSKWDCLLGDWLHLPEIDAHSSKHC